MGLFDIFKKKTPQHKVTEKSNPQNTDSVIDYVKAQKPDASEQEVADITSKLAGPEEVQDHLTPEGDLPWGWITAHEKEISRYETQYRKAWSKWFDSRSASPREHMIALESFVDCMVRLKRQLAKRGECYDCWRDVLFTDDYLERWSKELETIKVNIDHLEREYAAKQLFEAKVLPSLENELLKIIKEQQGVLQKDVYKMFDPIGKKYIQEKLYHAEKTRRIRREKCGNSYKLYSK